MNKQMPLEFTTFDAQCIDRGYTATDQRLDKRPANIFAIKTKNRVKVEIKTASSSGYVVGQGCKSEHLDILQEEIENAGLKLIKRNAKHMYFQFSEDIMQGFWLIVNRVEDIEALVRQAEQRRSNKFFEPNIETTFIWIAETIKRVIDLAPAGVSLSRGFGVFDNLDQYITKGHSIAGRLAELAGKTVRREHVVPCDYIITLAIQMFRAGLSIDDVAKMIQDTLCIIIISVEEQEKIDFTLKLKTTMPEGWTYGHDIFARLMLAGVILESKN